jgi:hypothetical protein
MRERAEGTLTFAAVAALAVAGWNLQRGATRIGALVAGAGLLAVVTRVAVDADLRGPALRGVRTHGPRVAIVGMLVLASLSGYAPGSVSPAGTAAAEVTSETITDGSVNAVVVKTEGTQKVEINIWGNTGDGARHYLRRTTVEADAKHFLRVNGAYDSYEVRVQTESSTTTVSIYGDSGGGGLGWNNLGSIGGDTNLVCGPAEKASSLLGGFYTDCNPVPDQSINVTELDNTETKTEVYQSLKTAQTGASILNDTQNDWLEDARNTALIVGKNAYIRALNNGSTKSAAKTEAKQAVDDYYAIHQIQVIEEFGVRADQLVYAQHRLESAGISSNNTGDDYNGYIRVWNTHSDGSTYYGEYKGGISERKNVTYTLLNGSSYEGTGFGVGASGNDATVSATSGAVTKPSDSQITWHEVRVESVGGNPKFTFMDLSEEPARWDRITAQRNSVHDEIDTFVNNTYSAYQGGEITNEDLVDPYLAAREYGPDPENYSAWATTTLTLMGQNTPETLENTGNFTVTDQTRNETLNGILLSDENPASGSFAAGETYDATALNGTQYVVTADGVEELTGNFTVESITTKTGESVESADYREINYTTTSTEGYQEVLDELAQTQAEIDALQEEARAPTGGGGIGGGGDFLGGIVGALGLPVTGTTKTAVAVGGGIGLLSLLAALSG